MPKPGLFGTAIYPFSIFIAGKVNFSHGVLDVPAPATRIILEKFNVEWKKGPVDTELCTPTGASILAALIEKNDIKSFENKKTSYKTFWESRYITW